MSLTYWNPVSIRVVASSGVVAALHIHCSSVLCRSALAMLMYRSVMVEVLCPSNCRT